MVTGKINSGLSIHHFFVCLNLAFLIFLPTGIRAANNDTLVFQNALNRLSTAGDSLLRGNTDSVRLVAHASFQRLLDSILHRPGGASLSFYQIKALSVVQSRDKRLKTITWLLNTKSDNAWSYHGYMVIRPKSGDSIIIKPLQQRKDISKDEFEVMKPYDSSWGGCIYYDIIQHTYKKTNSYLLLGWAPQSAQVTRKLAEAGRLKDNGHILSQPLIRAGGKTRFRMVFDYNASASMTLRYDEKKKMVVMDHLSPSDPRPEAKGMYALYGPDMTYDGLRFAKGYWQLIRDIDARNK